RLARLLEGGDLFVRSRHMARTRPLTRTLCEEFLDDAILERMEGDDDETAARFQRAFGGKQRSRQLAELVVDEDAQPLEGAGCRMDFFARVVTNHGSDRLGEILGALERTL